MTIPDAQKFIARWRKILIPRASRTEAEALNAMERSCVGICGGMMLFVLLSVVSSKVPRPVGAVAFIVGLLSLWLVLRFRSIRRLFATDSELSK